MNCDEFLESIDGSETLTHLQQEHVKTCESCKAAFIASTAFVASRKPLSISELAKITLISKAAISANSANEFSMPSKAQITETATNSSIAIKLALTTLILIAPLFLSSILFERTILKKPKPIFSSKQSQKELANHPDVVYTIESGERVFDRPNYKVTFLAPSSFVFTDKGLKIMQGRAKIIKYAHTKPLFISSELDTIEISTGSLFCKVDNGRISAYMLSDSTKQNVSMATASAKITDMKQSPIIKSEASGVVIVSPNKEEVDRLDKKDN